MSSSSPWHPAPPPGIPWREWLHFIVYAPEGVLLVNVSRSRRAAARDLSGAATLMWLGARPVGASWMVDLAPRSREAHPGTCRIGHDHSAPSLEVRSSDGALDARIVFATPSPRFDVPRVGSSMGVDLGWCVTPRLRAAGTLLVRGVRHDLTGLAYHDQNWGAWSDGVRWEWAHATIGARDFVLGELTAGGRTTSRTLLVFADGEPVEMYHDEDLVVRRSRCTRSMPTSVVPPGMALLGAPGGSAFEGTVHIDVRRGGSGPSLELRARAGITMWTPKLVATGAMSLLEHACEVTLRDAGEVLEGRAVYERSATDVSAS